MVTHGSGLNGSEKRITAAKLESVAPMITKTKAGSSDLAVRVLSGGSSCALRLRVLGENRGSRIKKKSSSEMNQRWE